MSEAERPTCVCPGCGGDGWTWIGLGQEQETCFICRGKGRVARDQAWRQRVIGLLLGLGFVLFIVGLAMVWGTR